MLLLCTSSELKMVEVGDPVSVVLPSVGEPMFMVYQGHEIANAVDICQYMRRECGLRVMAPMPGYLLESIPPADLDLMFTVPES